MNKTRGMQCIVGRAWASCRWCSVSNSTMQSVCENSTSLFGLNAQISNVPLPGLSLFSRLSCPSSCWASLSPSSLARPLFFVPRRAWGACRIHDTWSQSKLNTVKSGTDIHKPTFHARDKPSKVERRWMQNKSCKWLMARRTIYIYVYILYYNLYRQIPQQTRLCGACSRSPQLSKWCILLKAYLLFFCTLEGVPLCHLYPWGPTIATP